MEVERDKENKTDKLLTIFGVALGGGGGLDWTGGSDDVREVGGHRILHRSNCQDFLMIWDAGGSDLEWTGVEGRSTARRHPGFLAL